MPRCSLRWVTRTPAERARASASPGMVAFAVEDEEAVGNEAGGVDLGLDKRRG